MKTIIKAVALCWYDNEETGGEDCCLKKYTLNHPPQNMKNCKTTMCNGDCGRDQCLCVILSPEEIIPRPQYTLMKQSIVNPRSNRKRAGIKKPQIS